jgi:hypothetical protein
LAIGRAGRGVGRRLCGGAGAVVADDPATVVDVERPCVGRVGRAGEQVVVAALEEEGARSSLRVVGETNELAALVDACRLCPSCGRVGAWGFGDGDDVTASITDEAVVGAAAGLQHPKFVDIVGELTAARQGKIAAAAQALAA